MELEFELTQCSLELVQQGAVCPQLLAARVPVTLSTEDWAGG